MVRLMDSLYKEFKKLLRQQTEFQFDDLLKIATFRELYERIGKLKNSYFKMETLFEHFNKKVVKDKIGEGNRKRDNLANKMEEERCKVEVGSDKLDETLKNVGEIGEKSLRSIEAEKGYGSGLGSKASAIRKSGSDRRLAGASK